MPVSTPYKGTSPVQLPPLKLPKGAVVFVYIDYEILPGIRQWVFDPIDETNIDTVRVYINGHYIFNPNPPKHG